MTEQRRWTILAVGTFAQAATSSFLYGMPMLVPSLRTDEGLSLFHASLLVIAPIVGLLLTLIGWGALADRYGERIVIGSGVGVAAVLLAVVPLVHGLVVVAVLLALAGAFAASVNAASGRMVMGWFPVAERGLAMGTRQTSQPVGVALAALVLPSLAHAYGAQEALLFPALLCAIGAVLVLLLAADAPRAARVAGSSAPGSPYRGSRTLLRIHLTSSLLVVPQFAVATFTLVYLAEIRHWDASVAGRWVFGFQAFGAIGRIVSGVWSDRVRSRLVPMRQLAVASALLMLGLALGAWLDAAWIVLVFALGAVVTVADNGLAYVSVAEFAGSAWAGRALGTQNTLQNLAAIATAPMLAAVIGSAGYGWAFALTAMFPLLGIPLTPVAAERSARPKQPVVAPAWPLPLCGARGVSAAAADTEPGGLDVVADAPPHGGGIRRSGGGYVGAKARDARRRRVASGLGVARWVVWRFRCGCGQSVWRRRGRNRRVVRVFRCWWHARDNWRCPHWR